MVSIVTQYYTPFLGYGITGVMSLFATITAFMIPEDIETNIYAQMAKDFERKEIEFIRQEKPDSFKDLDASKDLSFGQIMRLKWHIIKLAFKEKALSRLFIFFIIQGLCMPEFFDFMYKFALDV